MRRTITMCGRVFGCIALALCLSCSRRTPVQQSDLVGTWQRVDKPAIAMTFLRDGTFNASVGTNRLLGGKYRLLEGERMALDLDATSPQHGSVTNEAFMLDGELTIRPATSGTERYRRVEQWPR